MRASLLTGLLVLWLLPVAGARAQAEVAQEEVDVPTLTARALEGADGMDPQIFERIAGARTLLALNALIDCCERAPQASRGAAYHALRHFAQLPDLERNARAFLTERALASNVAASQPAARTLAVYGESAHEGLERVLLESRDERTQCYAIGGLVEVLAERGTPDALKLLLEHYRPNLSGSARRGAQALARFEDKRCIKTLHKALTRSATPPEVRVMIAGALALRAGKDTTAALRKALRDKDTRVIVAAIDALQARGETDHLKSLEKFSRNKSAALRFAAFRALAIARHGSPEFEPKLLRALQGKDFALRMGAAAAFGMARDRDSAVLLALLIDDEHRAVRRAAIEAARDRRIIEAVPQLIGRMEQDGPRLRALAHESLVELTGLDHGPTPVRWRAWWEGEAGTFELPDRPTALAAVRQRRARKAAAPTVVKQTSFYGVRFATDRVIFVLDISGSMGDSGRLERMKRETLAALDEIEDDARFNLVFFETRVRPWGERMVKMTARNRALARQAVNELHALGGTNLHGGLGVAFADPDVETIVILSDGEPSEGVTGTESILRDVRRWNEMRGIVVHSVAVGWESDLLERLSAETGGEAATAL